MDLQILQHQLFSTNIALGETRTCRRKFPFYITLHQLPVKLTGRDRDDLFVALEQFEVTCGAATSIVFDILGLYIIFGPILGDVCWQTKGDGVFDWIKFQCWKCDRSVGVVVVGKFDFSFY